MFDYVDGRQFADTADVLAFVDSLDPDLTSVQVARELRDYFGPSIFHPREMEISASASPMTDVQIFGSPFLVSRAHAGVIWLLTDRILDDIVRIEEQKTGPWIEITLRGPDGTLSEYAVWRVTGNVYPVHLGEVPDDPIHEVTPMNPASTAV
jgi:hypothetical protein